MMWKCQLKVSEANWATLPLTSPLLTSPHSHLLPFSHSLLLLSLPFSSSYLFFFTSVYFPLISPLLIISPHYCIFYSLTPLISISSISLPLSSSLSMLTSSHLPLISPHFPSFPYFPSLFSFLLLTFSDSHHLLLFFPLSPFFSFIYAHFPSLSPLLFTSPHSYHLLFFAFLSSLTSLSLGTFLLSSFPSFPLFSPHSYLLHSFFTLLSLSLRLFILLSSSFLLAPLPLTPNLSSPFTSLLPLTTLWGRKTGWGEVLKYFLRPWVGNV